jgi:UDP-N-acetylmuramoyl-tripeptide--D-alanyl-D-alanine ligase
MRQFTPCELAGWCNGTWSVDDPDIAISGFCKDSRAIVRDDIYVALSGENHDGHDFIADAMANGASCALVESGYAATHDMPLLRVTDTCKALQDIAAGYRNKIDPFVVGVTGSSGKTTVKEMIAACLAGTLVTSATEGNWNNHIGLPLSLLQMVPDTECAVMEVGMNHPGELLPLCKILRPDWSVITNVGPVHLEHFESVEAIAREKAVLIENTSEDGLVFLETDGKSFEILAAAVRGELVTVSADSEADYSYAGSRGDTVKISETASGESCEIKLTLPGEHILFDAALAAAVARRKGVDWGAIASALSAYRPLSMRWEVSEHGGVTLINDAYNANPMSMRASINAFAGQDYSGKKCLVLGDMLELGHAAVQEHRLLGSWLEGKGISVLVAVGEQARDIAATAEGQCVQVVSVDAAGDAAAALEDVVAAGDAVLFKGSRGVRLEDAVASLSKSINHSQ